MPILTESSRKGLKSLSARLGAHQMRVPLVGGRHPIEDIARYIYIVDSRGLFVGGDSLPGNVPRKSTKIDEIDENTANSDFKKRTKITCSLNRRKKQQIRLLKTY